MKINKDLVKQIALVKVLFGKKLTATEMDILINSLELSYLIGREEEKSFKGVAQKNQ
jgi:hypothetical protein